MIDEGKKTTKKEENAKSLQCNTKARTYIIQNKSVQFS